MGATTVSRKALCVSMAVAMAFAMSLLAAFAPVQAYADPGNNQQYIERSWQDGRVVETTKTATDVAWMIDSYTTLNDGWWYTRDIDVTIGSRVSVAPGATANIILMDGATITFSDGINVPEGSTLNIYGQAGGTGKLIAYADYDYQAAIGGNSGQSAGKVNIHGGIVTADAYSYGASAAGIGGGWSGNGGDVTIYGGDITAKGANVSYDGGAGIGGGDSGHGGEVIIYGGKVNAAGGTDGAGIGGGDDGSGGRIEIWGGEVEATGAAGAGLGGGEYGAAGTVVIHDGTVKATGTNNAAGIGGGDGKDGGDVYIYGGNVTAKSSNVSYDGAAGIGGGNEGKGGYVYISGGTVNATGGRDAAGIGGGDNGTGGTVEIRGGNVTATGGYDGAGIGGGQNANGGSVEIWGGTVTATGTCTNVTGGAGLGGGSDGSGGTIKIHGGTVNAKSDVAYAAGSGAGIGGGSSGSSGSIYIDGGSVTAEGGNGGAGIGGGYNGSSDTIEIAAGTVTAQSNKYGAGIGGGGYGTGGTIIIRGGDLVKATGGYEGAGIGGGYKAAGGAVTISSGTVTATGGDYGAAIGGGYEGSGGTIKVNGGSVTATGGYDAAGIGGGDHAAGGDIEIMSGTVTATGGDGGAGIGGGDATGVSTGGSSGNITIRGGEVTATGGLLGAGIGGGNKGDYDNNGTIAISGGKVIATGGNEDPEKENPYGAAGIGGGYNQSGGAIDITGGEITAKGGFRSAGIGGGGYGTGGTIAINDATVKAYGGAQGEHYQYIYPEGGAGIGGGYTASGGTITIGGDASVEAYGADGAAGIGGGRGGQSGTITINGGNVNASSTGRGGAGIGSGFICDASGDTVNITIDGGNVTARGGRSVLETDEDGTHFYYSHPGAGIGAGGCADEGAIESRDTYSYFTGSISLNGGMVDAYVGGDGLSLSKAVIGGVDLGDTAKITVKGGCTVRVHQSGSKITGRALLKAKEVKLEDADGYSSRVSNLTNPSEVALTNERVAWCQRENSALELLIEPCAHEGATYTDNVVNHSYSCPHCSHAEEVEDHVFNESSYTWASDNSAVTAERVCAKCSHGELETVKTTYEVTKPATASEEGEGTYTATFMMPGFKTQTKTVAIPKVDWAKLTYSITLQDSIDVNFYVSDLADDTSEYTVSYGPGEEGSEGWKTATPESKAENKYVIASRAAKEMGDEVHVIVKHKGEVIKDATYSVKSYCDAVIEAGVAEHGKALVDLCKATLDYGRYAQKTFKYNTDKLVNGGTDGFDNEGIAVPIYDAAKDDKSEAVTGVTLSLVTTAKTQLVARFKTTATSAEGFKATVDGVDVTSGLVLENGKLKVVVEGIAAKDLDAKRTIVVTDPDEGTYAFTVSPVDYMGLAVANGSQLELNRAFYNYHLKAKAYQGPGASLNRAPSGGALTAADSNLG